MIYRRILPSRTEVSNLGEFLTCGNDTESKSEVGVKGNLSFPVAAPDRLRTEQVAGTGAEERFKGRLQNQEGNLWQSHVN